MQSIKKKLHFLGKANDSENGTTIIDLYLDVKQEFEESFHPFQTQKSKFKRRIAS